MTKGVKRQQMSKGKPERRTTVLDHFKKMTNVAPLKQKLEK